MARKIDTDQLFGCTVHSLSRSLAHTFHLIISFSRVLAKVIHEWMFCMDKRHKEGSSLCAYEYVRLARGNQIHLHHSYYPEILVRNPKNNPRDDRNVLLFFCVVLCGFRFAYSVSVQINVCLPSTSDWYSSFPSFSVMDFWTFSYWTRGIFVITERSRLPLDDCRKGIKPYGQWER